MSEVGRPTKYTPEVVEIIVKALSAGCAVSVACDAAGINRDTFYAWVKEFSDFSDTIKKAKAEAAQRYIGKIDDAAKGGTWQAAAWQLERLYPEDYGKTIVENRNIEIPADKLSQLSEEELKKIAEGKA